MDRSNIVTLLNSFIKTNSFDIAVTLIEEASKENIVNNKRELISSILTLPVIGAKCVDYSIDKLCNQHKINTVSKDNITILFY